MHDPVFKKMHFKRLPLISKQQYWLWEANWFSDYLRIIKITGFNSKSSANRYYVTQDKRTIK